MDGFTEIWNRLLVWPIEGALLWLTAYANSGLAIIAFTFIVRTLMLPLGLVQVRSQRAMMRIQPQMRELQGRHPNDRQRLAQEQMRLYKESGVNPLAGCFPLVLQMPIWFALYSALINLGHNQSAFQMPFLWLPNLAMPDPWYVLPVLTAATQWVVQKMSMLPTLDPQQQQMNRMMEFMPLMFFVFSLTVASGLTLYWVTSNVYSFFQQYFTMGWGSLPFLGRKPPDDGSGTPARTRPGKPAGPAGADLGAGSRSRTRTRRRGGSPPSRRRR